MNAALFVHIDLHGSTLPTRLLIISFSSYIDNSRRLAGCPQLVGRAIFKDFWDNAAIKVRTLDI